MEGNGFRVAVADRQKGSNLTGICGFKSKGRLDSKIAGLTRNARLAGRRPCAVGTSAKTQPDENPELQNPRKRDNFVLQINMYHRTLIRAVQTPTPAVAVKKGRPMALKRYLSRLSTTSRIERGRNGTAPGSGQPRPGESFSRDHVTVQFDHAESLYQKWPTPVCIIADGPYGVGGFPGDTPTVKDLPGWYTPHVVAWSRLATPETTLWFWNTELGWATVHPVLIAHGWEYRCCHIWDKGLSHVAGNANSQTLRKFPVVTEVCVQYLKAAKFQAGDREMSMQEWLRREWRRSGIPLSKTNEACGVRNAATRKYFTRCHLWYYPPVEAFERIVAYANQYGYPSGRPYFSLDGKRPLTGEEWARLRAKFYCEVGITNVWREPPVRGMERLKEKYRCLHNNQKPLRLMDLCIRASTDPGDAVWEPFGGLCSAAVSAHALGRACVSAEIMPEYYLAAKERLATYDAESSFP